MSSGATSSNSVTSKSSQMSIKLLKNDFTRKIKIFTPLQKLPKNVGDLGKVAQSPKIAQYGQLLPRVSNRHAASKLK